MIREEGEAATLEVGVHGIHPELVTSAWKYEIQDQLWSECIKTFHRSSTVSPDCLQQKWVWMSDLQRRAGLLHDIGKAVDHEMEGSHIQLGAELCRKVQRVR